MPPPGSVNILCVPRSAGTVEAWATPDQHSSDTQIEGSELERTKLIEPPYRASLKESF